MLRLVGFLLTFVFGISGFVAVDYTMAKRWADADDSEGLTLGEYFGGLSGRLSGGSASAASGLPSVLADMLPAAPEGWTVRPTEPKDIDVFLPKKRGNAPADARDYVEAVARARGGSGVEAVVLTYEKGERRVVIKAVRYPDLIFTSHMALSQRMTLQAMQPKFLSRDVMTVRGLDITEDYLPDGLRGRYFMADVGGQIHLTILASKRMGDEDLLPFFQTLHVKAMNASVVDKQKGLGDVPVIVLASLMDETRREAYEADRAARKQANAERLEADRILAEANALAAADTNEARGAPQDAGGSTLKGDKVTGLRSGDCKKRDGAKICGVGGGTASD